jgi:lipoprotein-releasing system permease protein
MILTNLQDAAKLYQFADDVSGVRLKLTDMFQAFDVSRKIADELSEYHAVTDWTARHANLFRAIKTEKTMMFIILSLIIAIAAFNIVSTMVMVVTDKESEIAILRTLGATPSSIRKIFMIQGTIIGVVGTTLGVICGILLATNVETIVPAIESLFNVQFLSAEVYSISKVPSDLNMSDVYKIATVSLVLSIAAAWFPARRAANVKPAEALRYE